MLLPQPRIIMGRTQRYDVRSGTPTAHRIITSRNRTPYHYVTHGSTFEYDDYGIHRGQMDRLSFFSAEARGPVAVHIYDCRQDSDELDRKMVVEVPTDGSQVLEIPPGYAHWFTDLQDVATRNDYSIFAPSFSGSKWNAMNDDVTVPVGQMIKSRPRVRQNDRLLPTEAQFLISRLVSESWRGGISRGAAQLRVTVGDREVELLLEDAKEFGSETQTFETGLTSASIGRGSFQQVREDAVTVASHVPSGIAQTIFLEGSPDWPSHYSVHPYITMQLSTLTAPNHVVTVDLVDRRVDSESFGERSQISLPDDPRLCLRIEPGVMWRIHSPSSFHYRVEYELHAQRAGQDVPAFIAVDRSDVGSYKFDAPGERVGIEVERLLAVDE